MARFTASILVLRSSAPNVRLAAGIEPSVREEVGPATISWVGCYVFETPTDCSFARFPMGRCMEENYSLERAHWRGELHFKDERYFR